MGCTYWQRLLNMNNDLSFIVCTRNRCGLLAKCVRSIAEQTKPESSPEIVVVDNGSNDDTRSRIREMQQEFPQLKYCYEPDPGLSHAKNRGIKEATAEWIFFVDDDATVCDGFVQRLRNTISRFDFDCIGGRYLPVFNSSPPSWLPDDYGLMELLAEEVSEVEKGWLSGGVMGFRKDVVSVIGDFSRRLGMRGKNIGYGEEILFQKKLRAGGFKIGFDPELIIHHVVHEYKLRRLWQIRSYFSSGKNWQIINSPLKIRDILYLVINSHFQLFQKGVIRSNFGAWMNYSYDLGRISGAFTSLIGNGSHPTGKQA